MKNATARTTRKAASFNYSAFAARLKGAIIQADNASAAILATIIELRGHADSDKARELFTAAYVQATAELRGVEPESLAKDVVVRARVADCMAVFSAPELPEGMTTRSVQGAAKACRAAAKPANDGENEKGKRAPRTPAGKGDAVSVDDIAPLALVNIGLERLRADVTDAETLRLIAETFDLIGDIAGALAAQAKPAKRAKRKA